MFTRQMPTYRRAIPSLVLVTLLGLAAVVAGIQAHQHHLDVPGIVFLIGVLMLLITGCFYGHGWTRLTLGLGGAVGTFSLIAALQAGLIWEAIVGLFVLMGSAIIPAVLLALRWPLRKAS